MADTLFDAMRGGTPRAGGADLLRLDPLQFRGEISDVSFSGGVAEYIYGGEAKGFGDIGPELAAELRARLAASQLQLARPDARIRATVIGASQYTMQVSGSTIFVSPLETLPLRNVPVIAPDLPLGGESIDPAAVAAAIEIGAQTPRSRRRRKPGCGVRAVARLGDVPAPRRFLQRRRRGIGGRARQRPSHRAHRRRRRRRADRHPLSRGDEAQNPIVSIDGLELKEFDYIDIGAILDTSGAVPVVIKSLVFPSGAGVGKDWQATVIPGRAKREPGTHNHRIYRSLLGANTA